MWCIIVRLEFTRWLFAMILCSDGPNFDPAPFPPRVRLHEAPFLADLMADGFSEEDVFDRMLHVTEEGRRVAAEECFYATSGHA